MSEQPTGNVLFLDEWRRRRLERTGQNPRIRRRPGPGRGFHGMPRSARRSAGRPGTPGYPFRDRLAGPDGRHGSGGISGPGASRPWLHEVSARTAASAGTRRSPGRVLAALLFFAGALALAGGLLWWRSLPPAALPDPRPPVLQSFLEPRTAPTLSSSPALPPPSAK